MELSEVFVETMEDLRDRCRLTGSVYDAAQAAGLLRRLLLDGHSLGPQQARRVGLKPEFRWFSIYHGSVAGHFLDPELGRHLGLMDVQGIEPGLAERVGDLQAFLRYPVIAGASWDVTVADLIRHYANAEGGVHFGAPRELNPALAEHLGHAIYADRLRWTVVAIGRVTYRALEPTLMYSALPHLRIPPDMPVTTGDDGDVPKRQ